MRLMSMWILLFMPTLFTTEAVEDPFQGFSDYIMKMMETFEVPGMAVGVIRNDKVIYAEGFGYRDVEKKLKVTPQTIFSIGSVSKSFTAMSLEMLVDDGKLDLDVPVIEYLPGFRLYDEYATMHATARDLLCHRTGLPGHSMMTYATSFSREEIFERLRFLEPSTGFRQEYNYNNLMYMTAGFLAGRVSGKTWEEFVAERIFGPLGMNRSNFSVGEMQRSGNFALPYEKRNNTITVIPFADRSVAAPAGGINSCVEDLTAWIKLHLNQGKAKGKQLISPSLVKEMHAPQITVTYAPETVVGPVEDYGLGWNIRPYRGYYLVHHGGWIDGYVSWISFMPSEGIGVISLSNKGNQLLPYYLHYNIYHRLLDLDGDWTTAIKPEKKNPGDEAFIHEDGPSPTHPLDEFNGIYEHPAYGHITIRAKQGRLEADFNGGITVPLKHFRYNVFVSEHESYKFDGLKFRFPVSTIGKIESLLIPLQKELDDIVFDRVAEDRFFTRQFLSRFIGDYEYQGQVVRVELRSDCTLIAKVPGQGDIELEPYTEHIFKFKSMAQSRIEFFFDKKDKVTQAVVHLQNGSFPAKRKL